MLLGIAKKNGIYSVKKEKTQILWRYKDKGLIVWISYSPFYTGIKVFIYISVKTQGSEKKKKQRKKVIIALWIESDGVSKKIFFWGILAE